MSINDDLLIEKYFQGALTPEERVLFEEKRTGDPAFSQEVAVHKQALQLIHQEGHQMMKERLAAKGKAIEGKRRRGKWIGWLLLVGSLLLLHFSGILSFSRLDVKKENLQPADPPQIHPSAPITKDTLHTEANDQANLQRPAEIGPADHKAPKQNTEELFAAYYTPFEDESLRSGHRGQEAPDPSDRFVEAYLGGHYTEALSLFEKMDRYDQQNDNMLFIKALCLIGAVEYSRAIPMLEQIIARDQTRFMDAARWYLALTCLKTGQPEKAKNQLGQLLLDSESSFRSEADALWKKL